MSRQIRRAVAPLSTAGLFILASCASTSETAGSGGLTRHVGSYAPAPIGHAPVRVGVPSFTLGRGITRAMAELAADQLTTLGVRTGRFVMIERTQLARLLEEQGLAGAVRADELAGRGEVRGVDYLLLGKITNFRVKREQLRSGFDLGRLPIPRRSIGALGYDRDKQVLKVDCGVDLRLVHATSGAVVAADFSEYSRTDTASSLGLSILGSRGRSSSTLRMSRDNQGKVLRLALDEALRKMLPLVDRYFATRAAD